MLVVENGCGAARLLEDSDHLLEPLVARIKSLAFFIAGVFPMLSDDHNPVDRQIDGSLFLKLFRRFAVSFALFLCGDCQGLGLASEFGRDPGDQGVAINAQLIGPQGQSHRC